MTAASLASTSKDLPRAEVGISQLPEVPVIQTLTISLAAVSIPFIASQLSAKIAAHAWLHRAIWLLAFIVNCFTVSIPGRFDTQLKDGKVEIPWRTLFEPAEWAFAIWGAIYLGEFALTAYAAFVAQPSAAFKESAVYWLSGSLFQSLWCFSFRPSFKRILFFPACFLAASSASFLLAFRAFHKQYLAHVAIAQKDTLSLLPLLLSVIPLALHATWLAGATLLNINGWAAVTQIAKPVQISISFASAFITAAVGIGLSVYSLNPFFAWTSAWALTALSEKSSLTQLKTFSEDVQKGISATEIALARIAQVVGIIVSLISAVMIVRPELINQLNLSAFL